MITLTAFKRHCTGIAWMFTPAFTAVLFLHCGTTGYNTYDVPCSKERPIIAKEARSFLARMGFAEKVFTPDSGYYRTRAIKVESVSETVSGGPKWFMMEVRHTGTMIHVGAFELIPDRHSEAARLAQSPEDEPKTEEDPIMPGDRFFIKVVQPLLDHLTEVCGG